jgi:hypothetical protein
VEKMSYDEECRESYKKTLETIQKYLTTQCKTGESIEAEVYGQYGGDCYLSINYDTIVGKKHISEFEYLPIGFLAKEFMKLCIPHILDALLKQWRS